MGRLTGVALSKGQGGLGRRSPSTDSHVAIIIMPTGDVPLDAIIANAGKGIVLTALTDAIDKGLTEAASANGYAPFFEHISDFFRLAPEGTLYVFNNRRDANLVAFLKGNKEVKGFGIVDDFDLSDQANLLGSYQANVIDALAFENRFIDFGVLGLNSFRIADAIDLTELSAGNMSACVAASGTSSVAAIGAYLGMIAVRRVNENAGSVDINYKPLAKRGNIDYPLTDSNLSLWIEPTLTGGTTISSLSKADLMSLDAKGYIFAAGYEDYAGNFFSDSKTAISRASDYCQIENNRTWNKAARIIRKALMPLVKGTVKKDPATGYIKNTVVSRWTGIANKALEVMVVDDEISGFEFFIDNKQVVNSTTPVKYKCQVVTDGIVHEFEGELGLTNKIQ